MFDMKAISAEQFNPWDNSPLHWSGDQDDGAGSAGSGSGFQYWDEEKYSEGCCFDIYAWYRVV